MTTPEPAGPVPVGRVRWVMCALLFFATVINYVDRQALGILAPTLQKSIGWNEIEYGYIVTAFQAAYASGLLLAGFVLDAVGVYFGFAAAVALWSVAAMAHAIVGTAFGFGAARAALGLSEAGNFPAAIKTVSEWFPKRERALATGLFNSGSNIGAIVCPLLVPWLALRFGVASAFVVTGAAGFVWVAVWLAFYRSPETHKRLTPAEHALIRSDPVEPTQKVRWIRLLGYRQTWAFAAGKFLTDPIWWFYLYWLPKFLNERHGLDVASLGPPLVIVYLAADIGSIGGGWLPSFLLRRGLGLNRSRKLAMLACALGVTPIVMASRVANVWVAVGLVALAAASHQGWSANLFTLVSDTFPRQATGSVVGIGGMAGAIGGMLIATAVGHILQWTGSYLPVFLLAGFNYLLALAVIQALAPRLEPAIVEG